MDKKRVAELKKKLVEEKKRLEHEISDIERDNLGQSQSEIVGENSYENHFADTGTVTFDRERDLSLERNVKDILEQVDRALERIKRGVYGICTRCGNEIDPARLKALPYAELCIACKRKEESGY